MLCLAITQRTPEVFLSLLFQSKESMAVLSVGGKKESTGYLARAGKLAEDVAEEKLQIWGNSGFCYENF